ncbi:hypothetical protein AM501_00405 [Aneurinibacillus migulanus]|uniref:hypothetical protein n=1 Tax=Aneurinibacillus migulanus TaxID=47500 RepID=UPI0005BA62BB|nr:hypothetical protein [Aneurinibacillus migulanus]KIV50599.1 hypothetical protein TS64_26915 [Aneurinibacillus migulanus]KPD10117.1 hypothetical protein AM501_00405 [Aneurinibacillus migulanus]MCP1359319.1 hypothetical protein [Aneurinibacillus migulanus]
MPKEFFMLIAFDLFALLLMLFLLFKLKANPNNLRLKILLLLCLVSQFAMTGTFFFTLLK